MARRIVLLLLVLGASLAAAGASALADGDPGSDVLVNQSLFLASDSGISVPDQVALGRELSQAAMAGFPLRVAIVATRADLGAVTGLWRRPRAYARFLSLELSLAYRGRLLVVMPNGLGFAWPGHTSAAAYQMLSRVPAGTGGSGPGSLAARAQAAIRALATASGVRLEPVSAGSAQSSAPASGSPGPARSAHTDQSVAIVAVGVLAAGALLLILARALRPRLARRRARTAGVPEGAPLRLRLPRRASSVAWIVIPVVGLVVVGAAVAAIVRLAVHRGATPPAVALARNPELDSGTPLSAPAPDFTLTDQFGRAVSLHSFRGRVVILTFNDSECTTLCPLTTTAMLDAKAMLAGAGAKVQLLGVDANPQSTAVADVLSYSQVHGMTGAWHYLTGSLSELKQVWKAYSIGVQISQREVDHTPAVFVIDPSGHLAKLYVTQPSYAAVGQLGQVLASEASRLLPGHPAVHSHLSYEPVPGIAPDQRTVLPSTRGEPVRFGPGSSDRLLLFFATWDREITSLGGQLVALNDYARSARAAGLPPLTAVDEASVEPRGQPAAFLGGLAQPLAFPVALDRNGRLADGYGVQAQPWLTLVSARGRVLWYYPVASLGWLSRDGLAAHVRAALTRAPAEPGSLSAVLRQLSGSPAPLASIHGQAAQILGGGAAGLKARLRALRGYPVVINVWASWCAPCRSEFNLFASAAARSGRRVAFLGVDANDSRADARTFLSAHPVSYPSYEARTYDLHSLAVLAGLPTTIFIRPDGKVSYVHSGQYDAQGTLDADINTYASAG